MLPLGPEIVELYLHVIQINVTERSKSIRERVTPTLQDIPLQDRPGRREGESEGRYLGWRQFH